MLSSTTDIYCFISWAGKRGLGVLHKDTNFRKLVQFRKIIKRQHRKVSRIALMGGEVSDKN